MFDKFKNKAHIICRKELITLIHFIIIIIESFKIMDDLIEKIETSVQYYISCQPGL